MALFLGVCFIFGDYSSREADFEINIVTVLGILLFAAIYWVMVNLFYYSVCFKDHGESKALHYHFEKHPFLCTFIILIVCWSFHLIIKYPAANTLDSMGEIRIDKGIIGISSNHPIFHALIYNAFLELGLLVGDINIGAFLSVLIEMFLRAAIFSYSIVFLFEVKAPAWSIAVTLAFYAVSPYVTGYVGLVSKDACCTDFIILFSILLGYYLYDRFAFFSSWKKPTLLIASVVFASLFRNNGIICVAPVLVIMFIRELKLQKFSRRAAVIILAVILSVAAKSGVSALLKAEKMDLSEALSLPFQQTARFVIYHEDLITDEEKEIISKVLPYDELPRLYNEVNSDPVKSNATAGKYLTQELKDYLRVWFKQFFKSPQCYLDAVIKQSIYMFYPYYLDFTNYSVECNSEYYMCFNNWFTTPDAIRNLQPYYREFMSYQHSFAPLAFINSMGFYVIFLLIILLYSCCTKDGNMVLLMLPGIIVIIEAFFAANISTNSRYILSVIWCSGVYLATFAAKNRTKTKKITLESQV